MGRRAQPRRLSGELGFPGTVSCSLKAGDPPPAAVRARGQPRGSEVAPVGPCARGSSFSSTSRCGTGWEAGGGLRSHVLPAGRADTQLHPSSSTCTRDAPRDAPRDARRPRFQGPNPELAAVRCQDLVCFPLRKDRKQAAFLPLCGQSGLLRASPRPGPRPRSSRRTPRSHRRSPERAPRGPAAPFWGSTAVPPGHPASVPCRLASPRPGPPQPTRPPHPLKPAPVRAATWSFLSPSQRFSVPPNVTTSRPPRPVCG